MGFFDTYTDTSGSGYVNAAEKKVLMDEGVTFPISQVFVEDHPEFGERYVASVTVPGEDGLEDRRISFPKGTVDSRDRMLDAMEKWLEDPDNELPIVKLTKVGRSIIIVPADAD